MPSFLPGYAMFALAGAVAAAGPVVIHLLNRRRFRVVSWAAMDFLREAVKRNRRILKLRDILLLILRTAAVLLFGLALARPYFASSGSGQAESGPADPCDLARRQQHEHGLSPSGPDAVGRREGERPAS